MKKNVFFFSKKVDKKNVVFKKVSFFACVAKEIDFAVFFQSFFESFSEVFLKVFQKFFESFSKVSEKFLEAFYPPRLGHPMNLLKRKIKTDGKSCTITFAPSFANDFAH